MTNHSYWVDHAPGLQSIDPSSSVPARADVAIVGGGFTGLAAARRLAALGASVVVVERGHVGSGASSRNAGQVLTGLRLDPATLIRRYGETRARQLFEVSLTALAFLEQTVAETGIDCDLQRTGHLVAASTAAHFAAFRHEQALLWRVFGHPVELVDRASQRAEVGSDAYHGLMIDKRSAGVNPARLAAGLAAAAVAAGARLVVGVAVQRARRTSPDWRITTSVGELLAREVLFATDAYTGPAAPGLQRRLIPVGSFIIVTEPLGADVAHAMLPTGRMAFDSRHFLHYFRLTPDRRLLFGGRAAFTEATMATTSRAAGILRRDMVSIFPGLRQTSIDYAWSGNVAFTRDQLPRAGRLDEAWYAAGYGGHGVAMAMYLGDQIARRIGGERLDQPLFDDACPAIPLYDGRPWFLPIVGASYRIKDALGR